MKLSKIATTFFGAALLLGTAVLAGEANKTTLTLPEKVNVEGKTLNPGSYKVEWSGTGNNVQVTISQGKETVATFQAQATEEQGKNAASAYGSTNQPDGSRSLTAIYVGGKRTVLQVGQASASRQTGNQDAK
jgi:hypothetical protein